MCAAHPQNLAGTAVLQPQKFIHDSTSFVAYAVRKQLLTNPIIGAANWQQTVHRAIWQLFFWLSSQLGSWRVEEVWRQPDVLSPMVRSPAVRGLNSCRTSRRTALPECAERAILRPRGPTRSEFLGKSS